MTPSGVLAETAYRVHQAHRDRKGYPEQTAHPDHKGFKEKRVVKDCKESRDLRAY